MFRSKKPKEEEPKPDILDFDLDRGVLARKLDGVRVVALSSPGWATIERELASTFMSGASVILQRVGYSYGRAMGRAAKNQQIPAEQAFEAMQSLARESGWGQLTLNGGDLTAGEARITVKDCFFCLHAKESTEPVCFVLAGLIGGMADEIVGATHRVTETKCIAKGDAACEILIERLG